jgi:hypothetical protein
MNNFNSVGRYIDNFCSTIVLHVKIIVPMYVIIYFDMFYILWPVNQKGLWNLK